MEDRAEGALQAMCSLGLIDGNTYLAAAREVYNLARTKDERCFEGVRHA